MSIQTYQQLKQSILQWGKRSDTLSLLDTFISMAESDMYAMPEPYDSLRIRDMEQTYTVTLGQGSTADSVWASGFWADDFWAEGFWGDASEPTRFIALPSRFIEARRATITVSGEDLKLEQRTPLTMRVRPYTGRPSYFTVTGELELDVVPDNDYELNMLYYGALEPLSATNTTNAVLTRFPAIYLHGALRHLFQWSNQVEKADYYLQQFAGAIRGANARDARGRYSPAPRLVVRGVTP
jgi:hypothetical protein